MTLQCRQSVLFNLHCSSIHPRQHTKLEQVAFIFQQVKTLLYRTADISTALEALLLLFKSHHFCTMITISVHVRKLPLMTENTLRARLQFCYCSSACVSNSKRLFYSVSAKLKICSPPRWVSSCSPKFILAQREFAIS